MGAGERERERERERVAARGGGSVREGEAHLHPHTTLRRNEHLDVADPAATITTCQTLRQTKSSELRTTGHTTAMFWRKFGRKRRSGGMGVGERENDDALVISLA